MPAYGTPVQFTATSLHSLAASSAGTAGWASALVDNTGTPALDFLIGGNFVSHASNRQAGGFIQVWALPIIKAGSPDLWPDVFSSGTEGTEGAATCHGTEQRDGAMRRLAVLAADAGASEVYPMGEVSLCQALGLPFPPQKWALFVTHNIATSTNAGLAASGSELWYVPITG